MKWWILVGYVCIIFILCLIASHMCVDVAAQKENYVPDYKIYHNLSLLNTYLKNLETKYPEYIKTSNQYVSKTGESQLFTRVSNFSLNSRKEVKQIKILLAFGEHAREFLPVESLLYFLTNLTSGTNCLKNSCPNPNYSYNFSTWLLSNFDIYIIAMTNPDGRRYIEKTKNYCWRGTSTGVDLNRNFDWNFGQRGSSSNQKDDEYRGSHAFSEPETRVLLEISKNISMDAFVSFHSGIRQIYIPFADSLSKKIHRVPHNYDHIKRLADKMSKSSPTRPFKYGVASELTGYFADGTSFDYMSGVRKIPFSFAIELWQHKNHQGRSCFDEFNPHSNNLQIELALIYPVYVEFFSYLYEWKFGGKYDTEIKDDQKYKVLVRYKKDEDHQRFPKRNDAMFSSESVEEESSLKHELKFLVVLIAVVVFTYLLFKQVLNLVRKKRIVSLRSLSSTFSLLKSV